MDLAGKAAIVTGASMGIGRAIALDLAANGADVAINFRRHDTEACHVCEEIVATGRRAISIRADVASFGDAQAMVERAKEAFGRVDILVNNAGINLRGPLAEFLFCLPGGSGKGPGARADDGACVRRWGTGGPFRAALPVPSLWYGLNFV